ILETNGYSVKCYANSAGFLKEFYFIEFKLMLLSVGMESGTGFKLADIAKKKDDKLKVCFMSEFKNYYDLLLTEYPNLDYKHFIQKPIKISELLNKIKEMLPY